MRTKRKRLTKASDIGYVWCDETRFDIVSIQIVDGSMSITAVKQGPFPEGGHDFYTVHGVDGQVFYRSVRPMHWPEAISGDRLEVIVAMEVTDKVAGP